MLFLYQSVKLDYGAEECPHWEGLFYYRGVGKASSPPNSI